MKFRKLIRLSVLLLTLLAALSACSVGPKPTPTMDNADTINTTPPLVAVSPSPSAPGYDRQMYAAYYEVAEEIVSKYGLFTEAVAGPGGFVRGMLIDLDGNGKNEFLCFYGRDGEMHNRVAIYTYIGNEVVLLLDELSSNGFGSLGVSSGISLSEVGGITYIHIDFGEEYHYQHLYVYRLENGVMKYREYYADTETEDGIMEHIVYKNCTIDGVSVSSEDYQTDYSKYYANSEYYLTKPDGGDYKAADAQAFLDSLKAMC